MSADYAVVGVKSSGERAADISLADPDVALWARRPASHFSRTAGLDWVEAENVSHLAAAENVAQAGAGSLLLGVGIVELLLGVWAAGWWQRGVVVVLALFGIAALARAVAAVARDVRRPSIGRTRWTPKSAVRSMATNDGASTRYQALIHESAVRGG